MTKLKRVVIKQELVELTGDYRAALILNQFIYWTERMRDTDKYIREEKERAIKEDISVDISESNGWIYKSAEELNDELMVGMSKPTIRKYIKQLIEQGYIHERQNPKYKWDKKTQYRLNLYNIQLDLAKLGYALEGYSLLPNIQIIENEDVYIDNNLQSKDNDINTKENLKNTSMHIDELRNIEDYKNIFELKMETSPVFANSRSETRDLITAGTERVVVNFRGVRILLEVCYDLRFPVWSRNLGDYDMILYVASWPTPRVDAWSALLRARAIENQCYVAGVNRMGVDPACEYSGGSAIIDPYGKTIAECPWSRESAVSADIDMEALQAFRKKFPVLDDADPFTLI